MTWDEYLEHEREEMSKLTLEDVLRIGRYASERRGDRRDERV
jgi:hypothetical protein